MSTPQKSLYRQISDAVTDGALPTGFSLSRSAGDEKKLAWADGAPDDIILYHMSISSFGEAARGCMKKTVQTPPMETLTGRTNCIGLRAAPRAVTAIDEMQSCIMDTCFIKADAKRRFRVLRSARRFPVCATSFRASSTKDRSWASRLLRTTCSS